MTVAHTRTEVESDIRETLGLVPTFFSRIPDELFNKYGAADEEAQVLRALCRFPLT
jgi:hypothetical protein